METNPDYASIFVTDAKGIGLAGTNPQNAGMDPDFSRRLPRGVGVWATANQAGRLFGKARLQETIRLQHGQSAAAIAEAIEKAPAEFRGTVAQQDDVTFVVVKPR